MSHHPSPYLKAGIICALLTTLLAAAFFSVPPLGLQVNTYCDVEMPAEIPPPPPRPPLPPQATEDVFFGGIREQMPLFPGCDDISAYAERKQCANKKMLEFIYGNIKYPAEAKENGVEGMAVVSFVVEKDGSISGAKAVRDPGAGTGAEAVRVVRLMQERGLRWEPGEQAGKAVKVQFNLPVKFKLEADKQKKTLKRNRLGCTGWPPQKTEANTVFKVVEQMPLFPGCDAGLEYAERKACADKKMLDFIYRNLRWPALARCSSVEGMAVVSFVVEKDGSMSGLKVVRDPGAGTGEEALRVVRLMSERGIPWEPGQQDGELVSVQLNIPVKFKLQ